MLGLLGESLIWSWHQQDSTHVVSGVPRFSLMIALKVVVHDTGPSVLMSPRDLKLRFVYMLRLSFLSILTHDSWQKQQKVMVAVVVVVVVVVVIVVVVVVVVLFCFVFLIKVVGFVAWAKTVEHVFRINSDICFAGGVLTYSMLALILTLPLEAFEDRVPVNRVKLKKKSGVHDV